MVVIVPPLPEPLCPLARAAAQQLEVARKLHPISDDSAGCPLRVPGLKTKNGRRRQPTERGESLDTLQQRLIAAGKHHVVIIRGIPHVSVGIDVPAEESQNLLLRQRGDPGGDFLRARSAREAVRLKVVRQNAGVNGHPVLVTITRWDTKERLRDTTEFSPQAVVRFGDGELDPSLRAVSMNEAVTDIQTQPPHDIG